MPKFDREIISGFVRIEDRVYINAVLLPYLYPEFHPIPGLQFVIEGVTCTYQVVLQSAAGLSDLSPVHSYHYVQALGLNYLQCQTNDDAKHLLEKILEANHINNRNRILKFRNEEIVLSDTMQEVLKRIKTFFNSSSQYKEYGFRHRRGVLLYGPMGTGKTSMIAVVAREFSDAKLYSDFGTYRNDVRQADCKKIIYLDEVESWVDSSDGRADLLHNLENTYDNTLVIGTTNLPNKLGPEFYNRPGRFDEAVLVPFPKEKEIKQFLKNKNSSDLFEYTSGLNFAHLNELIYRVKINHEEPGKVYKEIQTINRSTGLPEFKDTGKDFNIGFTS